MQTDKKRQIEMFDAIGSTFDISPDGSLFAEGGGWGDAAIKITETKTGKSFFLDGHPSTVKTIAYSSDGQHLAVGGSDKNIHIYDFEKRSWRKPLSGHSGPINSLSFSPDGRTLISCSEDKFIKIWNWREGNAIQNLKYDEDVLGIKKVSFSPNGLLFLMISDRGSFRLWSTQSGEIIRNTGTDDAYISTDTILGHNSLSVIDAFFSKDGKRIITAHGSGLLRIWDVDTGKQLKDCNLDQQISFVQISPDDKQVLAATGISDETQVKLLDVTNGEELAHFDDEQTKFLQAIALSVDGKYFATSDVVGDALLWSTDERQPIHRLNIGSSGRDSIAFSPDGKTLAIGGVTLQINPQG